MNFTQKYHELISKVLDRGETRPDPNREGTTRLQIPFYSLIHDLRESFPVQTTKKMWWKGIVIETLWLLRGEHDITSLQEQGVHIWDKDVENYKKRKGPRIISYTDNNGDVVPTFAEADNSAGNIYGTHWRGYGSNVEFKYLTPVGIDQLMNVIDEIKTNPLSSNLTIFGDNPQFREDRALPCCMNYMQFGCSVNTEGGFFVDLSINYRSHDALLGYPWNVTQYALVLAIIAKWTGNTPRYLRVVSQNVHLYDNQIKAAKEVLARNEWAFEEPKLTLPAIKPDMDFSNYINKDWKEFKLEDYKSFGKLNNQPKMLGYDE